MIDKVACLGFGLNKVSTIPLPRVCFTRFWIFGWNPICMSQDLNAHPSDQTVVDIGSPGKKHRTLICQTDEQTEMAQECVQDADRLRQPADG